MLHRLSVQASPHLAESASGHEAACAEFRVPSNLIKSPQSHPAVMWVLDLVYSALVLLTS